MVLKTQKRLPQKRATLFDFYHFVTTWHSMSPQIIHYTLLIDNYQSSYSTTNLSTYTLSPEINRAKYTPGFRS